MQLTSRERLERRYLSRWRKAKALQLPSWWLTLAPRRGAKFWNAVEMLRKESNVQRWDTSGMTFIINKARSLYERH